jgi:hypothetical protein
MSSLGVITYIDFSAAFDSVLPTLKEYGVHAKYCRLVKEVYISTTVNVRLTQQGGQRSYSWKIPIRSTEE